MRILWFTHLPMPVMWGSAAGSHAGTGGWMLALLSQLGAQPGVELAVACSFPGLPARTFDHEGVRYYCLPQPIRRWLRFSDGDNDPAMLTNCAQVVADWRPDLIHIHGTERFYGLLTAPVPILISIQGLLTECSRWRNYFEEMPLLDLLAMHQLLRVCRGIGPLWDAWRSRRNAHREQRIVGRTRRFLGRTEWDRAHLRALNPTAHYHHVGELLRPEFHERQWNLATARRHSIIFTNARAPRHGVGTLFRAVGLLKRRFPDVTLRLAGIDGFTGGFGRHVGRLAHRLGIRDNVTFLGALNAAALSQQLAGAHAFILSSLIENSPNSLCEAQLVGLPCVATYTGGVPSLLSDGETGFLVPVGDAAMMADRVTRLFEDDDLACRLGRNARAVALRRHDPATVLAQLLAAYREAAQ